MISSRLLQLVRCPDCRGRPRGAAVGPAMSGLRPNVSRGSRDFLVLRPSGAFGETTKFLDDSFHADGRDETVSPPLLSAAVRNTMLRKFLDMQANDVVLDLGCGSGRFCVWSLDTVRISSVRTRARSSQEKRAPASIWWSVSSAGCRLPTAASRRPTRLMCSSTCPRRGSARRLARLRACFSQEARYSFTRTCGNAPFWRRCWV